MTRTIARWVPENLDRSVDIIVDDSNNIQIRTGTASAPTNLPQLTYDSNSLPSGVTGSGANSIATLGQTVTNVTATLGTDGSNAPALQFGLNYVTGAAITAAVRLPVSTGSGRRVTVFANTSYFILVYPRTGEQISTYGANIAYALFVDQTATFIDRSAGNWVTEFNYPVLFPFLKYTAFSGGGQANATQVTYGTTAITVCAADGDSIKLPVPVGGLSPVVVVNFTTKSCRVYPGSGQYLNSMEVTDLPIDVPPNRTLLLHDVGPVTNSVPTSVNCWFGGLLPVQPTAPNTQTGATYTVASTDRYVIANRAGTVTLTLPTASMNTGREFTVKTIQAQTVVSGSSDVVPLAGGAAGTAILAATAGKWAKLVSDGTNWVIMEAA